MTQLVPAFGPSPNPFLLVGKAPGVEEMSAGRPHVGRAGRELKAYLDRHNTSIFSLRLTNLCREYVPPDTRLTPNQIAFWEVDLLQEITRTQPRLIITLGGDAARFFLGPCSMNTVHGIPHRGGVFDPTIAYRTPLDCCILPLLQPAAGFHSSDSRALIDWDFQQLAHIIKLIRQRGTFTTYTEDEYPDPTYLDVSGWHLASILKSARPRMLGIDTEGTVAHPFSLQVSFEPGTGYMLRHDQHDLHEGVTALQGLADAGTIFTGHNIGMYDLEMFRGPFGLDLFDANVHDTLFDLFLFCLEPLGLKPSSWRHLGMRMKSHNETVGNLGRDIQVEYLRRALDLVVDWPKPEPVWKFENDNSITIKQPNKLKTRIAKILQEIDAGVSDDEEEGEEDGEIDEALAGVDPYKRWMAVRKDVSQQAKLIESELGRMPHGSMRLLFERDPEAAINYSCMDSDASLRLNPICMDRLKRENKLHLAEIYSKNMHVFSEMQENGMPTRRRNLETLRDKMSDRMVELAAEISISYNDGLPYNPKSAPQTAKLFERWGLKGTKKTKGGAVSYGKKSVEHLKFTDDSMGEDEKFRRNLVSRRLQWLEHQHTRDMFCTPTLSLIDEDVDECTARSQLLPWGTHTGRLAAKKPNLLAQPKHSIYGQMIRDCYEAPEGYVFLESDLAGIEVCVLADHSNDPDLIRIMSTPGIKFHRETAMKLFNLPAEEVTDAQYYVSKRTIFLTFYGGTGSGLRDQLWMQGLIQYDETKCQEFIDGVKYRVYPAIGRYEEAVARHLRKHGKISDWGGMERYLPGIWSDDKGTQAEAVRHGVSQRIQGGAQRMIQEAISWLKDQIRYLRTEYGIDVKWRLTIHDSLLLTCPEWACGIVRDVVEEGLTKHCGVKLKVPVRAESKTAKTWGQL